MDLNLEKFQHFKFEIQEKKKRENATNIEQHTKHKIKFKDGKHFCALSFHFKIKL